MAAKGSTGKYPVRLTMYITEEMDDKLDDIASVMNISKNEFIRYQLGNALFGMQEVVNAIKEKAHDEMKK